MPILEATFPQIRSHLHNEDKRQLLRSLGFHWSVKKSCWWKLVGAEGEALAAELRAKFYQVSIKNPFDAP